MLLINDTTKKLVVKVKFEFPKVVRSQIRNPYLLKIATFWKDFKI